MTYCVTTFNAKAVKSKAPVSPYGDRTYVFQSARVNTHRELFMILSKYFVLNMPLTKIDKPIRSRRTKTNLGEFQEDHLKYIMLDVDDVFSAKSRDFILNYFKEYKCIIGASRSYNGIDNFRLKGILFVDDLTLEQAKNTIKFIHHELKDFCEIDESAVRQVSYNAPIEHVKIFLDNNGKLFEASEVSSEVYSKAMLREYTVSNDTKITYRIDDTFDVDGQHLTIDSLCLSVYRSMGFEAIRSNDNGSITFKHPSETRSIGGYFWFAQSPYTMHHPNSTKTINIFETVRRLDAAKELLKQEINYDDKLLNFNAKSRVITVNEQYLTITPEIQETISDFVHATDGLFSIKSPMGTGKSTIIGRIIQECHDEDLRVLIITNRISVAQDFSKKYSLKLYNKDMYEIGDSLVLQYDSLWKYNVRNFDVVIMDEFISLMLHSRSNLSNSAVNIAKFFGAFNKKLVIADAFLTGYENFLLESKKDNVYMVNNAYRDCTELYEYLDFNFFIRTIIEKSKNNKITISSTSLSVINELQLLLTSRGLRVVTLTANTPPSTKELIYDIFSRKKNDIFDVLIFSPTLTVGVSNLNNTFLHFHYDSSMSTDVISSLQMIKRTRRAKEIHLLIKPRISYNRTTYNEIRDEYMSNLGKNLECNYLFEVDNYGEPRLSEVGKKAIKIDTFRNILEFNHREAFLYLSKFHFLNDPQLITKTFESNPLTKYKRELKNLNNSIIENELKTYINLSESNICELLVSENPADKLIKAIAEIDNDIDAPDDIRMEILAIASKDRGFLQKCKYYQAVYNYSISFWDKSDISNLIHRSVLDNNTEDIKFFNRLLKIQAAVVDSYVPNKVSSSLKFLLDRCGYSTQAANNLEVGFRGYNVDPDVKKYYKFIK